MDLEQVCPAEESSSPAPRGPVLTAMAVVLGIHSLQSMGFDVGRHGILETVKLTALSFVAVA